MSDSSPHDMICSAVFHQGIVQLQRPSIQTLEPVSVGDEERDRFLCHVKLDQRPHDMKKMESGAEQRLQEWFPCSIRERIACNFDQALRCRPRNEPQMHALQLDLVDGSCPNTSTSSWIVMERSEDLHPSSTGRTDAGIGTRCFVKARERSLS